MVSYFKRHYWLQNKTKVDYIIIQSLGYFIKQCLLHYNCLLLYTQLANLKGFVTINNIVCNIIDSVGRITRLCWFFNT